MLGANGAGKTTLMRAALGLVPVASGRSACSTGRHPRQRRDRLRSASPRGHRRPEADRLGRRRQRRDRRPLRLCQARQSDEARDRLGARRSRRARLASRSIGELSGGERQRVLLSQALIGRPRLLLLDEPLISLDPAHQKSVVETARGICDDLKIAILFSAHELNPLVNAIDRVLYLGGGEAVIGAVDDVVNGPVLSASMARRSRSCASGSLFRDGRRRRRRARRASPR